MFSGSDDYTKTQNFGMEKSLEDNQKKEVDPMERPEKLQHVPFKNYTNNKWRFPDGEYLISNIMNNKTRYLSHIPGSYTVRFEEEKNCLDTNKIKIAYDEIDKAYSLITANGEALYMIRDGTMGTFVPEGELSDAFKWTFELNQDGTYKIWNKLNSSKVIGVKSIWTYYKPVSEVPTNSDNQKFKLEPIAVKPIEDGEYLISNKLDNKTRYLSHIPEPYTAIFKEEKNYSDANRIKVTYDENTNAYSIIAANGEALFMARDELLGTHVPEGELYDTYKWIFEFNKDGTYKIWNKLNSSKVIGVKSIWTYYKPVSESPTELNNQKFKLEPIAVKPIEDGEYLISNKRDSKTRYLSHIPGKYKVKFKEKKNYSNTNRIKIMYDENAKAYSLVSANGEALYMIRDGSLGTSTPEVELSDAFKWTFELNKDGTYKIWNKLNPSKVIGVKLIWTYYKPVSEVPTNSDNQKFKLEPIAVKPIEEGEYLISNMINNKTSYLSRIQGRYKVRFKGEKNYSDTNRIKITYDENAKDYSLVNMNGGSLYMKRNRIFWNSTSEVELSDAFKWIFELNKDGTYKIWNKLNPSKVIGVKSIWTYYKPVSENSTESNNQKFKLEPIAVKPIEDGEYLISNMINNKTIYLSRIQGQYKVRFKGEKNYSETNRIKITYDENAKAYSLVDVNGGVLYMKRNGLFWNPVPKGELSDASKWIFELNKDGTYKIWNKLYSSKVIGVKSIWTYCKPVNEAPKDSDNQKFKLERID